MPFFSKIYHSWSEIQNEKYHKIIDILKENDIRITGKILDVGCGPLYFEKFLESRGISAEITCTDIEKQDAENFVRARGEKLPFSDRYFDMVFCMDSIHLIENADDIFRVMKNGGFLIVSLFFNSINQKQMEDMLKEKLNKFKILNKTILKGKENEIVLICKK